jgi:hypothetical protein
MTDVATTAAGSRTPDPKAIVRDGYDRASLAYRADDYDLEKSATATGCAGSRGSCRRAAACSTWVAAAACPSRASWRSATPCVGVDISPVQIERARGLVPAAEFQCADMTAVEFAPASFDAVVAFYSIINVPGAEQRALIHRVATWLAPGGVLLAMVGKVAGAWAEPDFRGVPGVTMYWSHADLAAGARWLAEAGFDVVRGGHAVAAAGRARVFRGAARAARQRGRASRWNRVRRARDPRRAAEGPSEQRGEAPRHGAAGPR